MHNGGQEGCNFLFLGSMRWNVPPWSGLHLSDNRLVAIGDFERKCGDYANRC